MLIFRKAAAGELVQDSGLYEIYKQLSEVDVEKEGVKGAANFFAAKVFFTAVVNDSDHSFSVLIKSH